MDKRALVGAKIITCDEEFTQIDNGIILINEGKIEVSTRADAFSEKRNRGL